MTYKELLKRAYDAKRFYYPGWRVGQAIFNVLHDHHPEIADEIRGTPLDPFYMDQPSTATLKFLSERLG